MKNETPIYAIDFEGSKSIGIVEYGIAEILGGKITRTFSAVCAPKKSIPLKDAKFFGISNEFAQKFAPFEAHCELFSELRARGIFAAHNHSTEDSLLRCHIPSPGRVKDFLNGRDTLAWAPWLDSRKFAKFLNPSLSSEKLSDSILQLNLSDKLSLCAEKFCDKTRAKWHCALFDAIASALIIAKALEHIESPESLEAFADLKDFDF